MKKTLSLKLKLIIIITVILIFYMAMILYSDVGKITKNFQKINLVFLIPIFSVYLFAIFLTSLRQRLILKNMGLRISVKDSFFLYVAGLSMIITPFGTGQMIKSYFIEKKYGYPIYKTVPLVIVERFCDLLSTCIVIAVTLTLYYSAVSIMLLSLSLGLLLIFMLTLKNKYFAKILLTIIKKIPLLSSIGQQFNTFDESLKSLLTPRLILKATCFSVLIIFVEAFVINMGFLTFGINVNYFKSAQIFYTSLMAGTLSFIPGGIGTTEGSFIGLLVQRHFDLGLATSLILFIRFTTIWFATTLGSFVSYFITRKKLFI